MTFSLFDICLAITVSQGIFLAITIQLVPKKNKEANYVLSIILFITSIVCFGRILVFKYHNMSIIRIGTIVDGTIFLFGPLLYLYFRRLIFKDKKAYKLAFSHYIVFFLYAIYALWTFTLNAEGFKENYDKGILRQLFLVIELIGLLSIAFYTFNLTLLLKTYRKYESSQIAYSQDVIKYVKYTLASVGLFLLLWFFSFISYYIFDYYNFIFNYNTMWLSVCLFMYIIGFYSLIQPEIFRIPAKLIIKKTQKARISKDEIDNLKKNLHTLMDKDLIYLEPDLNLVMLAKYTNTSTNNLSWYLNKVENKTFYRYINDYRIKAFLLKINNDEHKTKTLIAMAFEVGFNTKSTFTNSFKTILHQTPAQYIQNNIKKV